MKKFDNLTNEQFEKIRSNSKIILECFDLNLIDDEDSLDAMLYTTIIILCSVKRKESEIKDYLEKYNKYLNSIVLNHFGYKN
jgi:hypothetical protein